MRMQNNGVRSSKDTSIYVILLLLLSAALCNSNKGDLPNNKISKDSSDRSKIEVKEMEYHARTHIIMIMFGGFVICCVMMHCWLKRQKLKEERRHRELIDEVDL